VRPDQRLSTRGGEGRTLKQRAGWWHLAERVCARLTTPRVDIADSDWRCDRLLQRSWLWSFSERLAGRVRLAWADSRAHDLATLAQRWWPSSDPVLLLSAVGRIMWVSALVAIALQMLGPSHVDPFTWALPAAVGVAGIVLPRVGLRGSRGGGSERG
jgi:hypothetical protein